MPPEFQLKNENEYTACEKTQVEKCKKLVEQFTKEAFFNNFLKHTPCKVEVQCVLLKKLNKNFGHADRMPNKGSLVNLYSNQSDDVVGLRGTLIHELTHAYDNCTMDNPDSPDNLALSEIRAYSYGQYPMRLAKINTMAEGKRKDKELNKIKTTLVKRAVRNISGNSSFPMEVKNNANSYAEKAWQIFRTTPQINPFL